MTFAQRPPEPSHAGVAVAPSGPSTAARDFWEQIFARGDADGYSRVEIPHDQDPVLRAALATFGDIRGKRVLDLGCGSGKASLFFARHGGIVTSIDLSSNAIANLQRFCERHGIGNIDSHVLSAMAIDSLGPFDYVYGSMVLHHIEPFEEFAAVLRRAIAVDGRAFFWENNMATPAMRLFREHCVGRFGIPKFGDAEESPLTASEVDQLRRYFQVEVEYPELVFFRLISVYLFRRRLAEMCRSLDAWFYRIRPLRRFSYNQHLKLGAVER